MSKESNEFVRRVAEQKYEYGFTTDVQTDIIEKGINEDVVRLISAKKNEPEWMLEFRLKAFRYWQKQSAPTWGHLHLPPRKATTVRLPSTRSSKRPSTSWVFPLRKGSPSAATRLSMPSWTPSP